MYTFLRTTPLIYFILVINTDADMWMTLKALMWSEMITAHIFATMHHNYGIIRSIMAVFMLPMKLFDFVLLNGLQ